MAAGLWGYVPWPAMWGRMPPPICLALATAILPSQDEEQAMRVIGYGTGCGAPTGRLLPPPSRLAACASSRGFPRVSLWILRSGFDVCGAEVQDGLVGAAARPVARQAEQVRRAFFRACLA